MKIISLKKRSEFLSVAKKGRKKAAKGLVLQVLESSCREAEQLHVGFTVTTKVGNAVVRNRIKRRLRALAREILPDRAKKTYDYVLIGRKACLDREFSDLQKDLKYVLHSTDTYQKS